MSDHTYSPNVVYSIYYETHPTVENIYASAIQTANEKSLKDTCNTSNLAEAT